MRRLVSQTAPAEKMTWFSWTPSSISSVPLAMRTSSCKRTGRNDRLELRPSGRERRLLDRKAIRVRRGHDELGALEAHEHPGENGPRLVAGGCPADLVDRLEQRLRLDAMQRDVEWRQSRKVLGAVHVEPRRVAPRRHREHALAFLVRERHRVVGQQPHEIGEKTSWHDDARVSRDLAADRRPQRDLHVRRREGEPVVLGLEQDAAEDLHRSARRNRSSDDAQSSGELGLRAGDAERGVGRHVCAHYLKNKIVEVVGV